MNLYTGNGSPIQLLRVAPTDELLRITRPSDGELMVSLKWDGTITYGPAYAPDDAARVFWTAIAQRRPEMPGP